MTKKDTLFFTLLGLFLITACLTLLGVLRIVEIDDFYLKGLFGAFLLELAATIFTLAKKGNLLEQDPAPEKKADNNGKSSSSRDEIKIDERYTVTVNTFKDSDNKEIRFMLVGAIHSAHINVRDGGPAWESPEKAWEHWQTFISPKLSPTVIDATDVFIVRHNGNLRLSNSLQDIVNGLFPNAVVELQQAGTGKDPNPNVSIHVSCKNPERFRIE